MESIEGPKEQPRENQIGGLFINLKDIAENHDGNATVKGVSGNSYTVTLTPDMLSIERPFADESFNVDIVTGEDEAKYIKFAVRTREIGTKDRLPDLYAGRLADAAIAYFGEKEELKGIQFDWYPYSDNHKSYIELKTRVKAELIQSGMSEADAEGEAKTRAALETWTARRLALPHGFTQVEIHENQETIDEGSDPELVIQGRFYKEYPEPSAESI